VIVKLLYLFVFVDGSTTEINRARKTLRAIINPLYLPPHEFRKKFRLSKPLVRQLILDLKPFLASGGHGRAISPEIKVSA